ncbi:hypothetical protein D3C72_2514140 [compost metagenome]
MAAISQFPPFWLSPQRDPEAQSATFPLSRSLELGGAYHLEGYRRLTRKPLIAVDHYDLKGISPQEFRDTIF